MESFEDDDDTHFCNKCHSTIGGLENYVRHRQSGCRQPGCESHKPEFDCSPSAPPGISYPDSVLNADAFFSSLELRSSAKAPTGPGPELLDARPGPRRSGRTEQRRQGRRGRQPRGRARARGPRAPPKGLEPPAVDCTDLDDLGIPQLVGFPDIVKPKRPPRPPERCKAPADWPTKDTVLTELAVDPYPEFDYQPEHYQQPDESEEELDDDDEDDDSLGMHESYSESDEPDAHEHPPRGHTGGKWQPGAKWPDDEPEPEPEPDAHEHPPPTHTGGKWKPNYAPAQKCDELENKEASGAVASEGQLPAAAPPPPPLPPPPPPPSHTRGKWVPGARADIGTGYWCSPCGRKLASRLVYNRHLLSDLHARRSIQEIDGAVRMTPALSATPPTHRDNLSQRQKILASKKHEVEGEDEEEVEEEEEEEEVDSSRAALGQRRRRREKEVLTCEMCRARVRRAQMGKHLLSHYHCRVAAATPSGPRARRFLLDNMANVVRQCPFQCAPCRFYSNTVHTFLRHWRSETHKNTVSQIEGSFICALCDFWCDDNESMEAHIMKQGHQDVVSMINGSVPIVIRRQRVLTCSTCCRRFRYNIQLRFHAKESGHEVEETASDEYQRRLGCSVCGQILRSLISLQRHQLACHRSAEAADESPATAAAALYFCSFCSMKFASADEATLHRRTSSHKETVRRKKSEDAAASSSTDRDCPYCDEKQTTLAEHKRHLLKKHPELSHRCARCGERFALSQELTMHTRDKKCSRKVKSWVASSSLRQYGCDDCSYSSESQAEYLFHKALHVGPVKREPLQAEEASKYQCSLCRMALNKFTLLEHLRGHTGEKPFRCANCGTSFARRMTFRLHRNKCAAQPNDRDADRKYTCSECNTAFRTKYILRQHILCHAGKQYECGFPGCPTILRTETELKRHRKLVHEAAEREFRCDDCSYAAKTKFQLVRHRKRHGTRDRDTQIYKCHHEGCSFKTEKSSHLKRHVLTHTGRKPYACRYCNYASNNLENLRKHILSTSIHPGKAIYQCESCEDGVAPFQTNFSKELRAHLLRSHPDKYPTPRDATNYIACIFDDSSEGR